MIYRKWSLLTGPAVLFGGLAGAVIFVDSIFRKQSAEFSWSLRLWRLDGRMEDQFIKTPANKQELIRAAK